MLLKIDGVEFSYPSVSVLTDVSFEIEGSQLISILGPNGVGKSTLIHCMNKILVPTGGTVTIDGKNVSKMPLKELAKEMGYVPYSSSDTFPLMVIDTVLMGRHPYSRWRSLNDDLEIVYETLKLMGIEHLAMRPFNELSAGQHQKVMLARGLVQEPKVLLLDEPTSNLDIKHQLEVTRILRDLSREKQIMIVMISHDLNIAAKYSDSMILMHEGSIHSIGVPEDVITEENLRTVYGVESLVISDSGRPHIILRDSSSVMEKSDGSAVIGSSVPAVSYTNGT
jgi:iron complex transport system ATP-binding protein